MRGARPEQAILAVTPICRKLRTPPGAMIEGMVDRLNTSAPEGLSGTFQ